MAETVLSVGIDIGTSTTQLVFSSLTIENVASVAAIPRITVVDKKVAVVAIMSLTSNEQWTPFAPGELKVFVDGAPVA